MKLFLDTAHVDEIKTAVATGMIDGVTTNPTLIAKTGRDYLETVKEICSIVEGPVSVEVLATSTADKMVEQALLFKEKLPHNIAVKLPLTFEALKAAKKLAAEGMETNLTLCFSVNQALLAAKAGATYVSPFVGRLDDVKEDGMQLVRDICTVYDNYSFETQVIVASVRNTNHVAQAALAGAGVATVPMKVFEQMIDHPLTDAGIKKFAEDWANAQNK